MFESLLVLSLVSLMLMLPILSSQQWRQQLAIQQFRAEFERRLVQTQQSAILLGRPTQVSSQLGNQALVFEHYSSNGQPQRETLALPDSLISLRQTRLTFSGQTGTVDRIRAFEFATLDEQKRFIYQYYIGSGRFVQKEQ